MEHLVDYDYYLDEYEGQDIDEDLFNKMRNTAEEVVLALINPSYIEKNRSDIQYAICLEIDYLNDNGFKQISIGKDSANYQSESYPRLLLFKR